MFRLRKRTLFTVAPAALAAVILCVPAGASDTTLQSATLSCSDGTLIDMGLDTTTLSALSDAVTAISQYPVGDPGLACTLSLGEATPLSFAPAQLMAGGGQVGTNFAFAAQGDATGGDVHGHYARGELRGPVTCLVSAGNVGVLGGPVEAFPGNTFFITAMDGDPDKVQFIFSDVPADQAGCASNLAAFPPFFEVEKGNVLVRGIGSS
jgi:hypothetical protein